MCVRLLLIVFLVFGFLIGCIFKLCIVCRFNDVVLLICVLLWFWLICLIVVL